MQIPDEIGGARVIAWQSLEGVCSSTHHHLLSHGAVITGQTWIAVGCYETYGGYYVFTGIEPFVPLTDTCHDTLTGALEQAEAEWPDLMGRWTIVLVTAEEREILADHGATDPGYTPRFVPESCKNGW